VKIGFVAERVMLSDEAWAWWEPLLPDRALRRGGVGDGVIPGR
jgi:hypothetical protein